jgi:hypothetical protein
MTADRPLTCRPLIARYGWQLSHSEKGFGIRWPLDTSRRLARLAVFILVAAMVLAGFGCGGRGAGGGRYYTVPPAGSNDIVEIHEADGTVVYNEHNALGGDQTSKTITGPDGQVEKWEVEIHMRKAPAKQVKSERTYRHWQKGELILEVQYENAQVARVRYRGQVIPPKG